MNTHFKTTDEIIMEYNNRMYAVFGSRVATRPEQAVPDPKPALSDAAVLAKLGEQSTDTQAEIMGSVLDATYSIDVFNDVMSGDAIALHNRLEKHLIRLARARFA